MTVEELIAELEYLNPEAEVRLATQPRYPLEYTLAQVVEVGISDNLRDDTIDETVVYLSEGGQIGYLPEQAAQELGW